MYSNRLQEIVGEIRGHTETGERPQTFLEELLACFAGTLGHALQATVTPFQDPLEMSLRLLLLSRGVSRLSPGASLDGFHYFAGMGLEQTGCLNSRINDRQGDAGADPLIDDDWYRLTLAFLHYLAGGYRVQALSILRHLGHLAEVSGGRRFASFHIVLRQLYGGRRPLDGEEFENDWERSLFSGLSPGRDGNHQLERLSQLAEHVHYRRETALAALGRDDVASWVARKGIPSDSAGFWHDYLKSLATRGISTFTAEQVGPGFDTWLSVEHNLLVVLPTGSGKSIVGELRTALALAQNRQVVWILPTRALVRQARKDLKAAFESLGVTVEELPTTEDYQPLFQEFESSSRHIAATTPEKLHALLRVNPQALTGVGLIVFDEAQLIFDTARGPTAESVLRQASEYEGCRLVLMSAFPEAQVPLGFVLKELGGDYRELVSDIRPTRRIYGVVTDTSRASSKRQVSALLYPPGLQGENGRTAIPIVVTPIAAAYKSAPSALKNAQYFVRSAAKGRLRTVLFVQDRRSTERQAALIASSLRQVRALPESDLARLRIELARGSSLLGTAVKGVLAHHAGLSSLEQHLAETWLKDGIASTVVATPTLAQGVNLPFDLSIVSYTSRYDKAAGRHRDLSQSDIMNMLGRAGRAGYVSDGICLLATESEGRSPRASLDGARRWFFRKIKLGDAPLGMRGLMSKAMGAGITESDWLFDLKGLEFGEAQAVVSYAAAAQSAESPLAYLVEELSVLPSMSSLSSGEIEEFAVALQKLGEAISKQVGDDPVLFEALVRTGMPISVLRAYIAALRKPGVDSLVEADGLQWADGVVYAALAETANASWAGELMGSDSPMMLASAITAWRQGAPMSAIEELLVLRPRIHENRMAVGTFLSRNLGLLSQFWGALALCDVVVGRTRDRLPFQLLQQIPVFVREGVSSVEQLLCLRALGGLDRVLAHRICPEIPTGSGPVGVRRALIRRRLSEWHNGGRDISSRFDSDTAIALRGVLRELFR